MDNLKKISEKIKFKEHHGKSQIPVWDAHGCPIWKHQVLGKYGKITTFCLN